MPAARCPVTGSGHRCPSRCGQWWPRPSAPQCDWTENGPAPSSDAGARVQRNSHCEPTSTSSKSHTYPTPGGPHLCPGESPTPPSPHRAGQSQAAHVPSLLCQGLPVETMMPRSNRCHHEKETSGSSLGCCSRTSQGQSKPFVDSGPNSPASSQTQLKCDVH